jgi:hypothetical protein
MVHHFMYVLSVDHEVINTKTMEELGYEAADFGHGGIR